MDKRCFSAREVFSLLILRIIVRIIVRQRLRGRVRRRVWGLRRMRFGIGWRVEIGTSILTHLEEIDVLEVLAEDYLHACADVRRAMRFLHQHIPIVVHATTLGLASTEPVDRKRLDAIARLLEWLQPDFWSEHLAFVRASGMEIGHLAAPPRNAETLEGLTRNVAEARRVVGSAPLLENVATLIDPPLSVYCEAEWLRAVLDAVGTDLLLDLHNLHANATNFAFDARGVLRSLPASRIGAIHLAGGRRIEGDRVLDDHLHDVPDPVFDLLAETGADRATVILERDGNYPAISVLLEQLKRARAVAGSRRSDDGLSMFVQQSSRAPSRPVHEFLARLYTNDIARQRFVADPYQEAIAAGFDEDDARRLTAIDPVDLSLAARSYARKRERVNARA